MPAAPTPQPQQTELAAGAEQGPALDRFMALVYEELHAEAQRQMRGERGAHTLQATALVNEAYARLAKKDLALLKDKKHFYLVAANEMRRILVDHARGRNGPKRNPGGWRFAIDHAAAEVVNGGAAGDVDLLALDEALQRLVAHDRELATLVELRYFGGRSIEEAAELLGVSASTVKRQWEYARAWLFRAMVGDDSGGS